MMPLLPLYCCRRSYLERHRPLAKYSGATAGQQQQLPERVARYTAQGEWVPAGLFTCWQPAKAALCLSICPARRLESCLQASQGGAKD
jgi:hypothetical protein